MLYNGDSQWERGISPAMEFVSIPNFTRKNQLDGYFNTTESVAINVDI